MQKTFKKKIIQKQRHQPEGRQNHNQPNQPSNRLQFKNRHNNNQKFEGKKFQHSDNTERPKNFKQKQSREPKAEDTEQK